MEKTAILLKLSDRLASTNQSYMKSLIMSFHGFNLRVKVLKTFKLSSAGLWRSFLRLSLGQKRLPKPALRSVLPAKASLTSSYQNADQSQTASETNTRKSASQSSSPQCPFSSRTSSPFASKSIISSVASADTGSPHPSCPKSQYTCGHLEDQVLGSMVSRARNTIETCKML